MTLAEIQRGIERCEASHDPDQFCEMYGCSDMRELLTYVLKAKTALQDVENILGPGPCSKIRCEGCAEEYRAALETVQLTLKELV